MGNVQQTAIPLSVQMFTLRELASKDFAATIDAVAKIGYCAVELAGWGNLKSAQEVRKVLDDHGVVCSGSHLGIEPFEKDLNRVLANNQILGNRNLVIPSLPEPRRINAAAWRQTAQQLSQIGQACAQRGFELSYHNHDLEFRQYDGQRAFDILLQESDANDLKFEVDVFWVKAGGEDPVAFLDRIGRRLSIVHLKDWAKGNERRFAPVGEGILDTLGIVEAGRRNGAKWFVIEQDNTYGVPPLEAVATSFRNLRAMGLA